MIDFKAFDRINKINQLIKNKSTGNPKEFANKLNISKSILFLILKDFRAMGAHIKYCNELRSYFYTKPVEIKASYSIKLIFKKGNKTVTKTVLPAPKIKKIT